MSRLGVIFTAIATVGLSGCPRGSVPQDGPAPAAASNAPASTLDQSIDKKVRLHGRAADAKAGAVIMPDGVDAPLLIDGLESWDRVGLWGARIVVEGTLRRKKVIPDPVNSAGEIVQGAWGDQLVIEGPKWQRE